MMIVISSYWFLQLRKREKWRCTECKTPLKSADLVSLMDFRYLMQIFAEACRRVFLMHYFQKIRKLKEVVLHSFQKFAVYSCFLISKSMLCYPPSPLPPTKHPLESGWLMSYSLCFSFGKLSWRVSHFFGVQLRCT